MDCDPGIDDALAILLALGSSEKIDVKAIVATFGNVALHQTKDNLLNILSFFKKVPLLGSGSKGPLKGKAQEARRVHGQDGLGDLPPHQFLSSQRGCLNWCGGVDLIIDLALSNKIDTIVATGPLTDLARAIKKTPPFLKNLYEIVIMGGAVFVKGNVTPYAEFNFHCDPEAAAIVLNADVRKRLICLDVTHKTLLTSSHLKPLKAIDSRLSKFILGLTEYSIYANKKRGLAGAPMHDPLAVALAIDEGLGEYQDLCLDVETKGRQRGRVVLKEGNPNTRFCKKLNCPRFFELFTGALVRLAREEKK